MDQIFSKGNDRNDSRAIQNNMESEHEATSVLSPPPLQFRIGENQPSKEEQEYEESASEGEFQMLGSDMPDDNFNKNTNDGLGDNNGLPFQLKQGIEAQSGFSMDDVNVHYNSNKPAQMGALAFAQGSDIHLGPSQEEHLPHEAWHVVQQKQGRVNGTRQFKSSMINDDPALEREADEMGAKALTMQLRANSPFKLGSTSADSNVVQRFEDEVVEGSVPEGRREELRRSEESSMLEGARSWQQNLETRQAFMLERGEEIERQYNLMVPAKNNLITNHRSAFASIDARITSANASISLRAAAVDFVLSLLPIRSSILGMRATNFTEMTVINHVAETAQSDILGRAMTQANAPANSIIGDITGTTAAPEQDGETSDQFALRLTESLLELANLRGDIYHMAAVMGSASYRNQVAAVVRELEGSSDVSSSRSPGIEQDARKFQENNRIWPTVQERMNRLVQHVSTTSSDLVLTQQHWSANNNHLLKAMLWINYLASHTPENSSDIDNDWIEDALVHNLVIGPRSYLGVDFGANTLWQDTYLAVQRARGMKPSVLSVLERLSPDITLSVMRLQSAETV